MAVASHLKRLKFLLPALLNFASQHFTLDNNHHEHCPVQNIIYVVPNINASIKATSAGGTIQVRLDKSTSRSKLCALSVCFIPSCSSLLSLHLTSHRLKKFSLARFISQPHLSPRTLLTIGISITSYLSRFNHVRSWLMGIYIYLFALYRVDCRSQIGCPSSHRCLLVRWLLGTSIAEPPRRT